MHTNPAGVALYVRTPELASRLQAAMPDVPVACAATLAELARLLQDVRWRAVAVEVAALGQSVDELAGRLSALFPDVPLIAIGGPADERTVAPLVATGCFHRFVRSNTSAARTRECFASALGGAARGRARAPEPVRPASRTDAPRIALAGGIAATTAGALAVVAWLLAGSSPPAGPATAGAPTVGTVASTPAVPPPAAGAVRGSAVVVGRTARDVEPLLAQAERARADGRLVGQQGDDAAAYYRQALEFAPDEQRARAGLRSLGASLLAAAEDAYDRRRLTEADAHLGDAASVLGDVPAVAELRERVAVARARAQARREMWETMAREWARPVPTEAGTAEPGPGG